MQKLLISTRTTVTGTLRLFFHDYFEGCNASVLVNASALVSNNFNINPSLPSNVFDYLIRAKTKLELQCPGIIFCSNLLAARDLLLMIRVPSTWSDAKGRPRLHHCLRQRKPPPPQHDHDPHRLLHLFLFPNLYPSLLYPLPPSSPFIGDLLINLSQALTLCSALPSQTLAPIPFSLPTPIPSP